jgi:hypothetical protein
MHTDDTLKILDEVTIKIGAEFRMFADKTCSAFAKRELRREVAVRNRRQQKKAEAQLASKKKAPNCIVADSATKGLGEGSRVKTFSLHSYKYHSLGDYADTICQFGTTDSYSTEPVRTCHFVYKSRVDTCLLFRVNWSTAHRKPVTTVQIEKNLQGSWPKLNNGKLKLTEFAQRFTGQVTFKVNL